MSQDRPVSNSDITLEGVEDTAPLREVVKAATIVFDQYAFIVNDNNQHMQKLKKLTHQWSGKRIYGERALCNAKEASAFKSACDAVVNNIQSHLRVTEETGVKIVLPQVMFFASGQSGLNLLNSLDREGLGLANDVRTAPAILQWFGSEQAVETLLGLASKDKHLETFKAALDKGQKSGLVSSQALVEKLTNTLEVTIKLKKDNPLNYYGSEFAQKEDLKEMKKALTSLKQLQKTLEKEHKIEEKLAAKQKSKPAKSPQTSLSLREKWRAYQQRHQKNKKSKAVSKQKKEKSPTKSEWTRDPKIRIG